jgi:hypothetical protein
MITGHRRAPYSAGTTSALEDMKAATARIEARDGHVSGHVRTAAVDSRRVTRDDQTTRL